MNTPRHRSKDVPGDQGFSPPTPPGRRTSLAGQPERRQEPVLSPFDSLGVNSAKEQHHAGPDLPLVYPAHEDCSGRWLGIATATNVGPSSARPGPKALRPYIRPSAVRPYKTNMAQIPGPAMEYNPKDRQGAVAASLPRQS